MHQSYPAFCEESVRPDAFRWSGDAPLELPAGTVTQLKHFPYIPNAVLSHNYIPHLKSCGISSTFAISIFLSMAPNLELLYYHQPPFAGRVMSHTKEVCHFTHLTYTIYHRVSKAEKRTFERVTCLAKLKESTGLGGFLAMKGLKTSTKREAARLFHL